MSVVVLVKEERASPGPDCFNLIGQEETSIKLGLREELENAPHCSIKLEEALLPTTAVKIEPLDDQLYLGQDGTSTTQKLGCFDNSAISEHFLAFSPGNKYNCQTCFKSFANSTNLHRHVLIHSRVKLECNICGKQYVGQELLDKHLEKHDRPKKLYPCEICNKKFKSSSNLMQHKRVHDTVKAFKCELCQKGFSMRANLIRHQGRSRCKPEEEVSLICKVCNKVFEKSFLLKSHLRKHDTDKPYQCDMCGLSFKYKSAIIRHMQWHSGHKPYKCQYCTKTFTHSGLIKPHLRIHTGEKPYQCSICLKLFTHKHNMERHKVNHGRIKRLVCDICNKKFPRESRLKYHMKTHIEEKFFDCGKCDKKFTHKSNVIRHYERKHPGFTYNGKDTDASVAMKVWDKVKDLLKPHYDIYQQPEEILG